jgi:hypothetical protein
MTMTVMFRVYFIVCPERQESNQFQNFNKAIAKELANRSAYHIRYVNVVIINIVFKVWFVSLTP